MPAYNPPTNTAPISVVIPCFNCDQTIGRAIESVAAQTLLPQELILVNDGSTDDTLNVIQNSVLCHPSDWIRIIELTENKGPGTARNIGWEAAKSPLIAFLDADDSWHPMKVEIQYRWMREHPSVSLTGHLLAWQTGDAEWPSPPDLKATKVTKSQLLFFSPIRTQTIMVHRSERFRFATGQCFGEDHFLLVNMACSGRNIALLNFTLGRIHKANYGAGGLSGKLWAMEKGQLKNYTGLLRNRDIGVPLFFLAVMWSLGKYLRRVALTRLRQLSHRRQRLHGARALY